MSETTKNNKNSVDYSVFFIFWIWDDPIGEGTRVSLLSYDEHSTHTFDLFDFKFVTGCSMKSKTFCYFGMIFFGCAFICSFLCGASKSLCGHAIVASKLHKSMPSKLSCCDDLWGRELFFFWGNICGS